MRKDIYESPLSSRYASEYMLHLFSPDMRFQTWRRLWVALARAEHELGLPITQEQVDELAAHITDIDYEVAEKREHEVRHDVMAHVYAYGKAAPSAAGIIHLGATSCYVTDNADLVLYRDGLKYLRGQLLSVMVNLAAFAREYAATPTLGYTHYQPAQPVTIGKRATLWMQDFRSDLEELDFVIGSMRFLGCRGTTGTEASFVDLFEGDGDKVDEMNRRIAAEFGFEKCFSVSGQTYPRKADSRILNVLSSIAQSAYRMANDIRLLQHDRQVEEPFEKNQIGSSAMPYKRNPMRMMEAVKRGGDRQELHEKIRQHSMAATARMKEGEPCDLLDRLAGDPAFGMTREELDQVMEPKLYIGRCEQQVLRFLDECAPLLRDAAAEDGAIDLIPERERWTSHLSRFFFSPEKMCGGARCLGKSGQNTSK